MSTHSEGPAETLPGIYPVGAVARATGLSEHTLRAWERRHGAIAPTRSAGGTRRYSEADMRRLLLLKRAVESGHRISSLAKLGDEQIEALLAPPALLRGRQDDALEEILVAVGEYKAERVEELLARNFAALGPRDFALATALPLLRHVGERWERGRLTAAAEHMVSSIVRNLLGLSIRTARPRADAPTVVLSTPTGELHEFGLLTAGLLAVGAGLRTLYLGTDLPAADIADAARGTSAAVVVLAVTSHHRSEAARFAVELRSQLAPEIELWVGGSSGSLPDHLDGLEIHTLSNFDDLEEKLQILEGRIGSG